MEYRHDFFSINVMAGYLYAHFLSSTSRLKNQLIIHLLLMAVALLFYYFFQTPDNSPSLHRKTGPLLFNINYFFNVSVTHANTVLYFALVNLFCFFVVAATAKASGLTSHMYNYMRGKRGMLRNTLYVILQLGLPPLRM